MTASEQTTAEILDQLYEVILKRKGEDPKTSYTASLLAKAPEKPARKLSEETTELLIEAIRDDKDAMVQESADLLYHLLVVWAAADIDASAVWSVLKERQAQSGLEEKASRSKS